MMQADLQLKNWHALEVDECVKEWGSDGDRGLSSSAEVQERRDQFGLNQLPVKKPKAAWRIFLSQFHQPLVYILLVAGGVTASLSEWVDSGVIFGVVLINAVVGFVQESKAVRSLDALAKSLVTPCLALRWGHKVTLQATELVPGDVVFVQSGDRVPADLRILRSKELRVDESALTGESVPVEKSAQVLPVKTGLADRKNLLHSGSLVSFGQGYGLVVRVGAATEVGRISRLMEQTTELMTPLTREIARFSRVLLMAILVLAGVSMLVGLFHGMTFLEVFLAGVALAVGAIPEGLPAAVTITLAIGVNRMAKRNAIIRKLPAVETLGSTTVICTDKTGTLTENQMTVREIWTLGGAYHVTGQGFQAEGELKSHPDAERPEDNLGLKETLVCGLLCNDSELHEEDEQVSVAGDPTEGALLTAGKKHGLEHLDFRQSHTRFDAIAFESERQYMATLHHIPQRGTRSVYVKGAVERILERVEYGLNSAGELVPVDLQDLQQQAFRLSSQGLRVLAFARMDCAAETLTISHADLQKGLIFLGFQGMIDPPRKEVIASIQTCRQAGIQVKMITGDHVQTALAIARQLALVEPDLEEEEKNNGAPLALDGQSLEKLSPEEFATCARQVNVFARVTPEQKLRLVQALQKAGEVTAMTGDGVNDAPALRQADIGVAMGRSGTEVAKEAADMVLADDNFTSIEAAVEEGRGVFDNLKKFIVWTLPTNLGEGLVILVSLVLGTTLPILPAQILWINMTTAILLGLMLAFEPKEAHLMHRKPRDLQQPLLDGAMIGRIGLVGLVMLLGAFSLFHWSLSAGHSVEYSRTLAVNVFVLTELCYLFNCRSLEHSVWKLGFLSNPLLLGGVLLMLILQVGFTHLPLMQVLFQTEPLSAHHWLAAAAVALTSSLIVAVEKNLKRRWRRDPVLTGQK